jgi:hypothetical protein
MPVSPHLSKATCYYTTRLYGWLLLMLAFCLIGIGVLAILIGYPGDNSYITSPHARYPLTYLESEIIGAFGLLSLFVVIPRILYSGPTLAVVEEGVYLLLWGPRLELIAWEDIKYFDAYGRNGVKWYSAGWGTTPSQRSSGIKLYAKDLDLLFEKISERYGKLPFLINIQYTLKRDNSPFRIRADTLIDTDRDEILKQLELGLVQHREKSAMPSQLIAGT